MRLPVTLTNEEHYQLHELAYSARESMAEWIRSQIRLAWSQREQATVQASESIEEVEKGKA